MKSESMTTDLTIFNAADQAAARRIKMLLPYGNKLTDENALALAAYSRIHGLDPFNGECYFLVRERKNDRGEVTNREELGVYAGIKGLRKKAREQIAEVDRQAHYTTSFEIIQPSVIGLSADKTAVVVKATLRDSVSTGRYLSDFISLMSAGLQREEIEQVIGKAPCWTGYGAVTHQETNYIKMTPVQLGRKRSEADAIRQRFDLKIDDELAEDVEPAGLLPNGDTDEEIITATAINVDLGPEVHPTKPERPRQSEQQIMTELGFG